MKHNNRRLFSIATLLFALIIVFSACSRSGNGADAIEGPETTHTTKAEESESADYGISTDETVTASMTTGTEKETEAVGTTKRESVVVETKTY